MAKSHGDLTGRADSGLQKRGWVVIIFKNNSRPPPPRNYDDVHVVYIYIYVYMVGGGGQLVPGSKYERCV